MTYAQCKERLLSDVEEAIYVALGSDNDQAEMIIKKIKAIFDYYQMDMLIAIVERVIEPTSN